jgi:hypothetical protein
MIDKKSAPSEDDGCVEGALTRMGQLSDDSVELKLSNQLAELNNQFGEHAFLGTRCTVGMFVLGGDLVRAVACAEVVSWPGAQLRLGQFLYACRRWQPSR